MNYRLALGYAAIAAVGILPHAFVIDGGLTGRSSPFAVFAVVLLLLWLAARPVYLVATRHPNPTRQLIDDLKARWPYIFLVFFVLVALSVTLDGSTQLKKQIPLVVPFYADPLLVKIDRMIFFGTDPWRVTHAIIGTAGTRVIDALYGLWHVAQISLCIWIALGQNRAVQIRAALSYQLAWLLMGSGLATALSSVGPCYYERFYGAQDFAPLMEKLQSMPGLHTTLAMEYLLEKQGSDAIGGGISAMPSLHVGVAVLILLCIRQYWPRWQPLGWAYVTVIYIGSVHLGWHYATDGMVAAVGMVLIWKLMGRFSAWIESGSVLVVPAEVLPA